MTRCFASTVSTNEMRAKIADFLFINAKRGRLTLDLDGDFRNTYDKLKDCDVEVSVKKWFPARSQDANRYAWKLMDLLAVETRKDKKEIYFDHLRRVGGNVRTYASIPAAIDDLVKLWEAQGSTGWGWPYDRWQSEKQPELDVVRLYYGSSTFDTSTMARFIDHLIQDCHACGIETRPQQEIDSMLSELE